MNDNIDKLIKILEDVGIDTSNMSEEDIRKLAATINTMANDRYKQSQEDLQQKLANLNKDTQNQINRRVQAPSSSPAQVNSNNTAPRNSGLDNKNDGPKGQNNGLNYTDNNNPRDQRPNVKPQKNNNTQNQTKPNPSVANQGVPVNNPENSAVRPETSSALPNKGGVDSEKNKKNNQVQDSNPNLANQANQGVGQNAAGINAQNGVGEEGPESAVGKEAAPDPLAAAAANSPGIFPNKLNPSLENVNNPEFNPDGTLKNPINVNNPQRAVPAPTNGPIPEEKKPKQQPGPSVGSSNPNSQNKRSYNPADRDAVARNKIDRAKERLRQNGIDPDQGTKPNKKRPPVTPPPTTQANGNLNLTGNTGGNGSGGAGGSGGPSKNGGGLSKKPSAIDRLRNRINGHLQRNREVDDTYDDPKNLQGGIKDQAKKKLKNKLRLFIVRHLPMILLIGGIVFLILFVVLLIVVILMEVVPGFVELESSANIEEVASGNQTSCTYGASGNLGTSEIKNVKVELINCDGKSSNYTTLETIDFEKYVLGVALAEIGPDSPDEGIKAQIVAARTFALSRNKGMCPNDPDNCFYGYNKKSNTIRMRACENDQVYWDYEKDIYRVDRGAVSLYSPEVNSGTVWKKALSGERRQQVEALADAVKGEVLVDSSGSPIIAGYKSSDQVQMLDEAKKGKTYKEILGKKYGTSPANGSNCQIGNIDYNDYQLTTDNAGILHTPLQQFLQEKGTSLEAFNNLIQTNVQKAGTGTRAGVVAAAVTLIGELSNKYNVRVPYFWGGGHEGTATYAKGNWGSTACHTYANNQDYNYCGLDCSGFVGWAIYNGGFRDITTVAVSYVSTSGARDVNLGSSAALQPADLLYSSGHVILVIGVDNEKGQYLCAEAAGNSSGVIFSRHSFDGDGGKYRGVDMTGFYENSGNKRG